MTSPGFPIRRCALKGTASSSTYVSDAYIRGPPGLTHHIKTVVAQYPLKAQTSFGSSDVPRWHTCISTKVYRHFPQGNSYVLSEEEVETSGGESDNETDTHTQVSKYSSFTIFVCKLMIDIYSGLLPEILPSAPPLPHHKRLYCLTAILPRLERRLLLVPAPHLLGHHP